MSDIEIEDLYNDIVGNLGRGDTEELNMINDYVDDTELGEFIIRRGFEEISGDDRREHMLEMIKYVRERGE